MSKELTYNDVDYLEEVIKDRYGFGDEDENSTDDLYSNYWLGQLPKHNKDLITLASYRRAVARFVKIATRKDIPVVYNLKGHSYVTDQEDKVILSAVCKNKEFDSVVGLALHESSHILWTDWEALKNLMDSWGAKNVWTIPQDLIDESTRIGYAEHHNLDVIIRKIVKSYENYIEDRRIDDKMIKMIPGYEPYYTALYKKYFHSKLITKGLESSFGREPNFKSYNFRIVNHINPASDPKALPGLEDIINLIDVANISRLENTQEVIDVAIEVVRMIVKNIPTPQPEQDEENENEESSDQGDPQDGDGSSQDVPEENDNRDDYEDAGDLDDSDPGDSGTPEPSNEPSEESDENENDDSVENEDENDDVSSDDGVSTNGENDESDENDENESDESGNGDTDETENDEESDDSENSKGGNADGTDEDIDENDDDNESNDSNDSNESEDGDEESDEDETDDESDSNGSESNESDDEDSDDESEDEEPEEEPEDLDSKDEKKLEKELETQSDMLDGDVKKQGLSKKDAKTLKDIEDAGTTVEHVQGDSKTGTDVYVVRKLNKDIMLTFGICDKDYTGERDEDYNPIYEAKIDSESQEAVTTGTRLGKLLAKKLQVRNETKVYKSKRKTFGKVDRRLLHQLGVGTTQIFETINKDQYGNAVVHITIDASGSMSGEKWKNTMIAAVAIAYAATQVENLEVVISFRGTYSKPKTRRSKWYNYDQIPLMVIAYDSRKDKFKKIQKLFPYIGTFGITPEGLCYEAVMKDILKSMSGKDGYFINFSDGYPNMVNENLPEYSRMNAYEIAKHNVDKIRANGVKILSFFITSKVDPDMSRFKMMYGKDATHINVTQVVPLARALNKLFTEK